MTGRQGLGRDWRATIYEQVKNAGRSRKTRVKEGRRMRLRG